MTDELDEPSGDEELTHIAEILGEDDDLVGLYLKHYGVKGMRWGVRKEDEPAKPRKTAAEKLTGRRLGNAALEAEYRKAVATMPKPTPNQQAAHLQANQSKFAAKAGFSPDDIPEDKKWKPTGKQVALGVAGLAVVGLVGYSAYKYGKVYPPGEILHNTPEANAKAFNLQVMKSKMMSWGGSNYLYPSSFEQQDYSLPAGHTFHRISKYAEDSFRGATYATHSTEDYHRYLTAFRHELGPGAKLHHVTFQATEEIKIPALTMRLETMREVLSDRWGKDVPHEDAVRWYTKLSGGSWDDPIADGFFEALGKKGYHAIVDDMDAGVIGDSPLVIFKPSSFSSKSASVIKAEHIKEAESLVKELANRKLERPA